MLFELVVDEPKIIVFSAIGFETRKLRSDSIKGFVILNSLVTELDEVAITPNRENLKLTIGAFKKSRIHNYFACSTNPWIVARYFPYEEAYSNTRFLDKLRIFTRSDIKDSKFSIRLYSRNEKGEPKGYIYDKNIFGVARKGKKITEIDLSDLNIVFPEKGFFVAMEWLVIDENKHEYIYTELSSNEKRDGISYEPAIGAVPTDTDENSWIFHRGKWSKVWKNESYISSRYSNKYSQLAIELTLTN